MGRYFSSEGAHGNPCGQGSCDNPLWPCLSQCSGGEFPSARGCRASYIPWHRVTSKVKCEQAFSVLVAPCSGEVILEGSLQMVFKLPVKLPGLLLGRCSFHIQNCAPDGWGISWISTTDRGDTAQPREQGKVRKTWINLDSTAGSAWLGSSSHRQPQDPIFIIFWGHLACFTCVQVRSCQWPAHPLPWKHFVLWGTLCAFHLVRCFSEPIPKSFHLPVKVRRGGRQSPNPRDALQSCHSSEFHSDLLTDCFIPKSQGERNSGH